MRLHPRTIVAVTLCLSLVAPLPGGRPPSEARGTLPLQPRTVALAAPPVRVHVNEPPRVKPSMLPRSAIRPTVVQAVRPFNGVRVVGPPMLRPHELDAALKAAARRRMPSSTTISVPAASSVRRIGAPGSVPASGARHTQSLPSDPNASGTGINPWWRYQEQSVPGGGRVMVNVGTGNLLYQDDDMSVPHKGIAMAFRRTYNSQAQPIVSGQFVNWQSLYGNGWTNTFDAHLVRMPGNIIRVYDIDGATYDYGVTQNASGVYVGIPPPGQHATLVWDQACGVSWTKKSGTMYYFYYPNPNPVCSQLGTVGGYAGRLYQIIGRNRNTSITFSYSWDGGIATTSGKISQITAQTESGMTTTLAFADFNGRRLLQQVTFPDNATAVQYGYDANGNLNAVSHPPNNAAGTRPLQYYGYQTVGTDSAMLWASSPRWNAGSCCVDGSFLYFGFAGSSAATSTVSYIVHEGYVNPTIPDPIQPAFTSGNTNFLIEYYTTGVATPTFRDTDGHMTNWVVDGFGRPTQTQECTASASQGQQCTGTWLIANETWDADSNLTAEVDPRGNQTDYAYDGMGNTIAVAQPQVTTSQGTFRPTSLFSYDSFNNVTAYCDPNASHALALDWTSAPSGDALCPITNLLATRFIWSTDPTQSGTASANPSYEPYGEQLARIAPGTPAGYRVNYAYDSTRQGGADYGLPTTVAAAAPIGQTDGTQRQPTQDFWYDGNGWLGCYNKGSGTWVLNYDLLGRVVTTGDPDDSTNNGICNKMSGVPGWNTASTTAYFPDGSVSSKQSASQRAAGVSTMFTYDLDGNESSETHHFGCVAVSTCTAGVTNKWYDGADRLVEVSLPYDAYDIQGYPMMTRYIYDLSQGGTTQYQNLGLRGYGNLVKTQELLSGTIVTPFTYATSSSFTAYPISTGAWTDVRATSFDGLDRALSSYEAAFASQPKATNTYDGTPPAGGAAQLGLLSSVTLATNEMKQYAYDSIGRLTDTTYSNDNGATSPAHLRYDASGRVVSRGTDVLGNETLQYDAAGELTSVTKPGSLGGVTISYDYYSDGARKDLNFASAVYTASPLYQYAYRADGHRSSLKLNNGSAFSWAYTAAGRLQRQTDPLTGGTVAPDNFYTVGQSQAPHYYYPSSVTYVAETYSFDNYGRTVGVTLPAGVFSQSVDRVRSGGRLDGAERPERSGTEECDHDCLRDVERAKREAADVRRLLLEHRCLRWPLLQWGDFCDATRIHHPMDTRRAGRYAEELGRADGGQRQYNLRSILVRCFRTPLSRHRTAQPALA
jgi:YD repeat-containing protein